jgi:hypothetical protein
MYKEATSKEPYNRVLVVMGLWKVLLPWIFFKTCHYNFLVDFATVPMYSSEHDLSESPLPVCLIKAGLSIPSKEFSKFDHSKSQKTV